MCSAVSLQGGCLPQHPAQLVRISCGAIIASSHVFAEPRVAGGDVTGTRVASAQRYCTCDAKVSCHEGDALGEVTDRAARENAAGLHAIRTAIRDQPTASACLTCDLPSLLQETGFFFPKVDNPYADR